MPGSFTSTSTAQRWAIALVVAASFVLAHPYTGVRHDGTLYLGDALVRLIPDGLHDDPYFAYGSQGRFTILPAYYAALIQWFGIGGGTMVGLLLAFALYLVATRTLVAALVVPRWQTIAWLAVVLGWSLYGGKRIFGYSEPFLTARSYAEPCVLLGLAWLVRGRRWSAGAALAVALLVHPLIALAGWLVFWVFLVFEDRRWLWAGLAAVVALAGLGATGAGPFSDVFSRYDAEWLGLVQIANPQAFVAVWDLQDFGVILFDAVLLGFAVRTLDSPLTRRFALAAALAGVGAILVSYVLVDLLENPFFGKLQIWRAQWVMQWTAIALSPVVLLALWKRGDPHARLVACLLAIAWIAPFSIALGLLAALAVVVEATRSRFTLTPPTIRAVGALTIVIGLVVFAQQEARVFKLGVLLDQPLRLIVGQFFAMNLLIGALALGVVACCARLGRLAPLPAIAVLVLALLVWDQRGEWVRKMESYAPGTQIWKGEIPTEAKVYWYRDLVAPWILLKHGNYYTQQQVSGAVFSRAMVVELERRAKVTALLDFQEQLCRTMNNLTEKATSCEPDGEAVKTVCTDGGIDFVVLQSTLENAKPLDEFSTGVVENGYEKRFYLYRCSALNAG